MGRISGGGVKQLEGEGNNDIQASSLISWLDNANIYRDEKY